MMHGMAMQVARKEDLCIVSLKNESNDDAWMSEHNRLALVASAENASQSADILIMLYIKLSSCAPHSFCQAQTPVVLHVIISDEPGV